MKVWASICVLGGWGCSVAAALDPGQPASTGFRIFGIAWGFLSVIFGLVLSRAKP